MLFVTVYTPGSAWMQGQPIGQQPFLMEHARYLQTLFDEGTLIMGGSFSDNSGGFTIVDAPSPAAAQGILDRDPILIHRVLKAEMHPWDHDFDRYAGKSLAAFIATSDAQPDHHGG